ncbi:SAM-dependent chlorinase/fluorinase, partial [Brevundimonas denitrificans]|uniref:SAM-dependent chlorinase/fluorinase n=1 Tax=Brevundimonas denitrificans TaxID=1443434 RepID=UPI0024E158B7
MILLFTDFGAEGPYLAQMTARLRRAGYTGEVLSLFADAPVFSPKASGYLLAAYMADFERDSVFLSVVDPGVGGRRKPVVVRSQGRWFVGPDNGLF